MSFLFLLLGSPLFPEKGGSWRGWEVSHEEFGKDSHLGERFFLPAAPLLGQVPDQGVVFWGAPQANG